jgi:hypothetical protein
VRRPVGAGPLCHRGSHNGGTLATACLPLLVTMTWPGATR